MILAKSRNRVSASTPPKAAGDKRYKILETQMKRFQYRQDALIEVLHRAQELFGFLDHDLMRHIAHHLRLPPSRVFGVATFYHFFNLKPKGAHSCVICMGTACYVKGADKGGWEIFAGHRPVHRGLRHCASGGLRRGRHRATDP
jgi:bidirectional [NiFe] hydrogenase diaphorase subunit